MIDLVIPMVFPQDPEWQKTYYSIRKSDATHNARFRSWGTEELLIRCCRKWMPWLRRIHILLAGESQVQPWMTEPLTPFRGNGNPLTANRSTLTEIHEPQVKLVFHEEFIPAEYLPCFNVNTIEMFLHRIPDLSEYFIYSNDDLFPLSPLAPEDFFRPISQNENENQNENDNFQFSTLIVPCQHIREVPYPARPDTFQMFVKNGLDLVAGEFGAKFRNTWLVHNHSMTPMLRSTVEHVCNRNAAAIARSITFSRTRKNYNQYIFPFWQHLSGNYIDYAPVSRYTGPGTPLKEVVRILRSSDAGIVCLNDNEHIRDWQQRADAVRIEIERKLVCP